VATSLRLIQEKIKAMAHDVHHVLHPRGLGLDRLSILRKAYQPGSDCYKDLIVFSCSLKLPSCLSAINMPSSITSENESGDA